MSENDDDDLATLREQTSHGDRLDEAPAAEQRQAFVDAIVAELEAIERGDQQKTVSVWDGPLAAFIRALEDNPDRLEEVGHALQRELDLDEHDVERSEVLRLALRLGFKKAAPEAFEAVREAAQQQATKGL
ncbi:hypothetical protein ACFQE8_25365 [Salinirubellus sp. GCM10025818]|uniref:hypothetical protein n=1 Tax=Salinirubellus sp. GCM10025818 TaxID=3252688 RepID=UPI0036122277